MHTIRSRVPSFEKMSILPVFDCAFAPPQGGRSIRFQGHLRMMAAVQPFLSGAISKTVNMPTEATVAVIREAYLEGWKLGLKALAIYRDGSRGSQPVSTQGRVADTSTPISTIPAAGPASLPKPVIDQPSTTDLGFNQYKRRSAPRPRAIAAYVDGVLPPQVRYSGRR